MKMLSYISIALLLSVAAHAIDQVPEIFDTEQPTKARKLKDWTFITYMAADNDLAPFSRKNLSQQAAVGSTDTINVLVHLDTRIPGNRKITKRYYVEKNQLIVKNQNEKHSQRMDSGSPDTLIDACAWAIKNYPARNYALILWNHGTGIIDITRPRTINPSELFTFNTSTNMIELDRSVPFLEFLKIHEPEEPRGVCFDDSTGRYLTNQGLEFALETICQKYLRGKRFSIIGYDACLMSMIEVTNILKDYTDIVVGSQEVELGTGWRYDLVLSPFAHQTMKPAAFATHIVNAYEMTYSKITHDYTQSAINMHKIQPLEDIINQIAQLLIKALQHQKKNSVKDALRTSRHKLLCTHFDEPSYIDMHHFLKNLRANLSRFKLADGNGAIISDLKTSINKALRLINEVVIANTAGKNLNQAHGISMYFPERRLHSSYRKTKFAKTNAWPQLIEQYLNS